MTERISDPLHGIAPKRVQLTNAPLERVLAQVQFPPVMKINEEAYIANFQEALRSEYPLVEKDEAQSVEFHFDLGAMQTKSTAELTWRFFDVDKIWRVSLNQKYISIETAKYSSREDFLKRFQKVLQAATETVNPQIASRVGFRYINRIIDEDGNWNLSTLVHKELLGVLGAELHGSVQHGMSDAHCKTEEGQLIARWGLLPANSTPDSVVLPAPDKTWILDIDSFNDEILKENNFDPERLVQKTNDLANRAYAFFRWSVTDEFLSNFGANNVAK